MSDPLTHAEVARRLPAIWCIEEFQILEETARLTARAPDYFWRVPASTSGYHHPVCRGERGLWAHTLMLSTVIGRLAPSLVAQGRLSEREVDYAHAAAILHDQRKNGDPENPSRKSTPDHDLHMADVIRGGSSLPDAVADAVASHMGPYYDGPEPETPLQHLVHEADMVASTSTISPAVFGPLPDELRQMDLKEVERADG